MTWIHWVMFSVLCLLGIGAIFGDDDEPLIRLISFLIIVGMILLLLLGQPK